MRLLLFLLEVLTQALLRTEAVSDKEDATELRLAALKSMHAKKRKVVASTNLPTTIAASTATSSELVSTLRHYWSLLLS